MTNFNKNSAISFPEHFKRAFNMCVGCNRTYSRETVRHLLGLKSLKTLENWGSYSNDCVPDAHNMLALMEVLPAGFKSMIEDYFNNDEAKNFCFNRLNTDLMKFMASYAAIIEDGTISVEEKKKLTIEIPEVIEKLDNLLTSIK